MPDRNSEIQQIFEDMLSNFLEWDGVYKIDSIDRALLKTEANSLYKISKSVDRNLRSRFVVTAKGNDLDIIGEGMNRPRIAGESDNSFRNRLIINDTFFNDSTITGLKNALRGYYGIDIDQDEYNDTKIIELYKEALRGGDDYTPDIKFLGEEVIAGSIEVHLMMIQEGDEAIISRNELFEKIYSTRAAGILLYLIWHGNFEDSLKKKLQDTTSLTARFKEIELGNKDRIIAKDDYKINRPIFKKNDILDCRTKGNKKTDSYNILVGTEDSGVGEISYINIGSSEDNDNGKRFEDDIAKGEMTSRRVHRLLCGKKFALPKDFQIPMKIGQRENIILYNHGDNITKEIMQIESKSTENIRIRIDEGTNIGYKATLQVVPKEYNGYDLLYFGDSILTDYLLEGRWYNINEKVLIEDADIKLYYNPNLDEYVTNGYYISPPINIDGMTKFGMVKWIYNTGNISVQIRTGSTESYLESLGDNDNWGSEYIINTGEFIQEMSDNFFQFKISLIGNEFESPIFRLREFFIEYWNIPLVEIEEIYDDIEIGNDLVSAMSSSIIGNIILKNSNTRGNGGSYPDLELNKTYWVTNIQPIRMPRIRNRRWTLFYGVKTIITDYFTREAIHKYERDVEVL